MVNFMLSFLQSKKFFKGRYKFCLAASFQVMMPTCHMGGSWVQCPPPASGFSGFGLVLKCRPWKAVVIAQLTDFSLIHMGDLDCTSNFCLWPWPSPSHLLWNKCKVVNIRSKCVVHCWEYPSPILEVLGLTPGPVSNLGFLLKQGGSRWC